MTISIPASAATVLCRAALLAVLVCLATVTSAAAAPPAAPTITSAPSSPTKSDAATFRFTRAEAGGAMECALDDELSFSACSSPTSYFSLDEGQHTFFVRQVNSGGEVGQPATHTWTVDLTNPDRPTITGGPPAVVNAESVTFTFTGAEPGASLECSWDNFPFFQTCPTQSSATYGFLTEGSHTFYLRQRDAAGNVGPLVTRAVEIDRTAPSPPTIMNKPAPEVRADKSGRSVAVFSVAPREPYDGSELDCRLDGSPWAQCGADLRTYSVGLGQHTFEVREYDAAQNVSQPASYTWTVLAAAGSTGEPDPGVNTDPVGTPDPVPDPPLPSACAPKIARVAPASAMRGERVAIEGAGFDQPGRVLFGAVEARVEHWSTSLIVAFVPANAPVGKGSITVRCGTGAEDRREFEVIRPRNVPPVAEAVALPTSKRARYVLDASGSFDIDGRIVAYHWLHKGKQFSRSVRPTRTLKAGRTYAFTVVVEDDKGATDRATVRVKVASPRKRQTVRLRFTADALFRFDYCTLTAKGRTAVSRMRKHLRGAYSVRFEGHADAIGTHDYNDRLAACRANTVMTEMLRGSKLPRGRAVAKGYGERRPRASNSTPQGRLKNRRVEVVITYNRR